MNFKEWLVKEYGTKITATGLNSAGMAQHGSRYRMSVRPARLAPKLRLGFKKTIS